MKKYLPALAALLLLSASCFAQGLYDGYPNDSVIIRLDTDTSHNIIRDTASSPLWQVGKTTKAFHPGDTVARVSMITDTAAPYPANANNWFGIKIPLGFHFNVIVDFWHRYSTDSFHDGGLVEFSIDTGVTWQNMTGDCNIDSNWNGPGIFTSNFYGPYDTLATGEPCFHGSSGAASRYSRFQFFVGFPVKGTTTGCEWNSTDTIYIRFRFISDMAADTLAGWDIDSLKIEYDNYPGSVARINNGGSLRVSPNPSTTGIFTFPALANETGYSIDIYNSIGTLVRRQPYDTKLDLSGWGTGLYFYRVSNGTHCYKGQLLKE